VGRQCCSSHRSITPTLQLVRLLYDSCFRAAFHPTVLPKSVPPRRYSTLLRRHFTSPSPPPPSHCVIQQFVLDLDPDADLNFNLNPNLATSRLLALSFLWCYGPADICSATEEFQPRQPQSCCPESLHIHTTSTPTILITTSNEIC
jgi:hypothetical protein